MEFCISNPCTNISSYYSDVSAVFFSQCHWELKVALTIEVAPFHLVRAGRYMHSNGSGMPSALMSIWRVKCVSLHSITSTFQRCSMTYSNGGVFKYCTSGCA